MDLGFEPLQLGFVLLGGLETKKFLANLIAIVEAQKPPG
jgi:hypothetical protein